MDKEALIKLIGLGIITGGEEFIEDMKKELGIDDKTKCEETEEQINARFLRGKQDEIDNLKKEAERQKWKAEKYSNAFCEEIEKRKEAEARQREAERIADHQEALITKALELLEYVCMSDTKKIEVLTNVIKQDRGYIKERNDDTVNFRFGKFKNIKGPEGVTGASN